MESIWYFIQDSVSVLVLFFMIIFYVFVENRESAKQSMSGGTNTILCYIYEIVWNVYGDDCASCWRDYIRRMGASSIFTLSKRPCVVDQYPSYLLARWHFFAKITEGVKHQVTIQKCILCSTYFPTHLATLPSSLNAEFRLTSKIVWVVLGLKSHSFLSGFFFRISQKLSWALMVQSY